MDGVDGDGGETPGTGEESELQKPGRWTRFAHRRLRIWQPVLAPRWVVPCYLACGLGFPALGVNLLMASNSVVEYVHDYTDAVASCPEGWPLGECSNSAKTHSFEIEVREDMTPPILLYYQLEGFHQNHRRYVKSKERKQFAKGAEVFHSESDLKDCEPWIYTCDAVGDEVRGECPQQFRRINYPCGLVARTVFNDSYVLLTKKSGDSTDSWQHLAVDSRAETIAWKADTAGAKFANIDPEAVAHGGLQNQALLNMWAAELFPPVRCEQIVVSASQPYVPVDVALRRTTRGAFQGSAVREVDVLDCEGSAGPAPTCNFLRNGTAFSCTSEAGYEERRVVDWGVESGHFAVWMRIAGLPTFRKLWGRIDQTFPAGSRLKVYVRDNFPVLPFKGRKAFVVSTRSMMGGKNDFLGCGYVVVGACCFLFGLAFASRHLTSPRALGDIGLLSGANSKR